MGDALQEPRPTGRHALPRRKIKWDTNYQKERGITTGRAKEPPRRGGGTGSALVPSRVPNAGAKRLRPDGISGWPRMASCSCSNPTPTPTWAKDEDFADAAQAAGIGYGKLIQRVLNLGIRYFGEQPAGQSDA